jgi:hypothetical protein
MGKLYSNWVNAVNRLNYDFSVIRLIGVDCVLPSGGLPYANTKKWMLLPHPFLLNPNYTSPYFFTSVPFLGAGVAFVSLGCCTTFTSDFGICAALSLAVA